jgi:ferritin
MISSKLEKAINQQIQLEMSSAYSYLGMSAYFHYESLSGFAQWFQIQYEEELQHALRLFHYLIDREGQIKLAPIEAPKGKYDSPLAVFKTAQKMEQSNTASINELYKLAVSLNDHATISHLQWFVDEQVEEEKNIGEALALVERAGNDPNAILYLNDKFGTRQPEAAPE